MVKASCLEGNIQSWASGSSLLVAAAKTRRANVMLLIEGSKSLVVALMDLNGSSQLMITGKNRSMCPLQKAKVGHQRVHIGILAFALGLPMDSRPNGGQRVFPVWLFGRRRFRLVLSHRCLSGPGIGQPSLKLLDAKFESCNVAFPSVSCGSPGQCRGLCSYLRSFPRANWSLALEHSFSRPAFSQAVHAGNLPSHWGLSVHAFQGEGLSSVWLP